MALTHARPSSRNADVALQLALQAHSSHPQSCARLLFSIFLAMTAPGGKLAAVAATASFPVLSRLGRAVASDSVVMCARLHAECASTPPSDARSDFPPGAYSLIVSIGRFVPSRPQWDEYSISHFRGSVNPGRVTAATTRENEGELNHRASPPVRGKVNFVRALTGRP